jgi:hypothetical protein
MIGAGGDHRRRAWLPPVALAALSALAGLGGVLATPTTAQSGAPPCPAPVQAEWTAGDVVTGGGTLVATHTIIVQVDFSDAVDSGTVEISAPPGVALVDPNSLAGRHLDLGTDRIAVVPDAAGPLPMTVTWQQDDLTADGGVCNGSASTTLQVQPALPLRLSSPGGLGGHGPVWASGFEWRTLLGPRTDRRPLTVRVRSVRSARLPGSGVPFQTVTLDPQADPNFDPPAHVLGTPGWLSTVHADRIDITVRGEPLVGGSEAPLGYELQVLQGNRQIADIRAAGHCSWIFCSWRKLRVQR